MSITLKFDEKGYLPGLAHQLVNALQDHPEAELLRVGPGQGGLDRELVFGLKGPDSDEVDLLLTDIEVLVAARQYCQQCAPEFLGAILKHATNTSRMIDQQMTPTFASSRDAEV